MDAQDDLPPREIVEETQYLADAAAILGNAKRADEIMRVPGLTLIWYPERGSRTADSEVFALKLRSWGAFWGPDLVIYYRFDNQKVYLLRMRSAGENGETGGF